MRVLLIDDDKLITVALKTILETDPQIKVCASGCDGSEACSLYDIHEPDILLMDIRMKNMDGLEATRHILEKHPEARIILLTTFLDDEFIVKAIRLGACGYLLKQDYEAIIPALHTAMAGQSVFGKEVSEKIPSLMSAKPKFKGTDWGLTEKEEELTALVAQGKSNKEIAEAMCFSEGTVRNYLSVILEKLQLRDRTQLAIFYLTRN